MSEAKINQPNSIAARFRFIVFGDESRTKKAVQENGHVTRKVTSSVVAGSFTVIIVWVLNEIIFLRWLAPGPDSELSVLEVPSSVASAFTTVISFWMAYRTSPSIADGIKEIKSNENDPV